MLNRLVSSVSWHLGALINICYMWFSKNGAEIHLGAATIHLAPPGEFAGLWFTNTCWENCFKNCVGMVVRKGGFMRFNLRRKIWYTGFQIRLDKGRWRGRGARLSTLPGHLFFYHFSIFDHSYVKATIPIHRTPIVLFSLELIYPTHALYLVTQPNSHLATTYQPFKKQFA